MASRVGTTARGVSVFRREVLRFGLELLEQAKIAVVAVRADLASSRTASRTRAFRLRDVTTVVETTLVAQAAHLGKALIQIARAGSAQRPTSRSPGVSIT